MKEVCIDMSFIKGVGHNLTEAEITFDKFHAVNLVNDAVAKVRRAEKESQFFTARRAITRRSRAPDARITPVVSNHDYAKVRTAGPRPYFANLRLETCSCYDL